MIKVNRSSKQGLDTLVSIALNLQNNLTVDERRSLEWAANEIERFQRVNAHLEDELVQAQVLRDQWCAEYTKLRDIVRDAAKWHTDRLPPPGPYHPSLAALIQAAKDSQ